MSLEIPGRLYTPVMQLVNDHGYSVEQAIAKAEADAERASSRTQARRTATKAPSPDAKAIHKVLEAYSANEGVLTIPIEGWTPPAKYAANAGGKLKDQFKPKKNARQVGREAAEATGYTAEDVPAMPVAIVVIHWENASRRKDSDNALACCKHVLDGMCKGLGIDDKRFITSMAFQRIDPDRRGRVDIIIRPATKDERRLHS